MTPALRRKLRWVVVALCVVAILAIGFEMLFGTRLRNRATKPHLAQVMAQLSVGMPQDRVEAAVAAVGDPRLRVRKGAADQWTVEMPPEFGAKDWILWVDLRESRVARLRMRVSDSIDRHPEGAPADKP